MRMRAWEGVLARRPYACALTTVSMTPRSCHGSILGAQLRWACSFFEDEKNKTKLDCFRLSWAKMRAKQI